MPDMAIRRTFYTPSDDFSYTQSTDDARQWLRSRGYVQSIERSADGLERPGPTLDDLDEADLARWVATATLADVQRQAAEGKYVTFPTSETEWVSVIAGRIEAVAAEVVDEPGPWPALDEDRPQLIH